MTAASSTQQPKSSAEIMPSCTARDTSAPTSKCSGTSKAALIVGKAAIHPQGVGPLRSSRRSDSAISMSISVTNAKLRIRWAVLGKTVCTTNSDTVRA